MCLIIAGADPGVFKIVGKEGQHKLGAMQSCSPRKTMMPPRNRSTTGDTGRRGSTPYRGCRLSQPKKSTKFRLLNSKCLSGRCARTSQWRHALGYVGQWLTEWPSYHKDVKALLGHAPRSRLSDLCFSVPPRSCLRRKTHWCRRGGQPLEWVTAALNYSDPLPPHFLGSGDLCLPGGVTRSIT